MVSNIFLIHRHFVSLGSSSAGLCSYRCLRSVYRPRQPFFASAAYGPNRATAALLRVRVQVSATRTHRTVTAPTAPSPLALCHQHAALRRRPSLSRAARIESTHRRGGGWLAKLTNTQSRDGAVHPRLGETGRSVSIIASGDQTRLSPDKAPYFWRDLLRGGVRAIGAVITARGVPRGDEAERGRGGAAVS